MYEWIYKLKPHIEREIGEDFFNSPAANREVNCIEEQLKIILPISYESFLKICDGTQLSSTELFSAKKVIQFNEALKFTPWSGKLTFDIEATKNIDDFSSKPLHFLVFAQMDSVYYCFDTSQLIEGEYPICIYESDNEVVNTLKIYYKSFDKFILEQIKEMSDWWEMPPGWYHKTSFEDKINSI